MDNRVSKSAVNLFGEISAVKEQRVNGSCINKLMLRCTLKGFERNYQVRIPSNRINKVYTERCLIKLFVCMINLIALLFILIGIFGSDNRVKASFYLFLYTLLGSLFLLLSILEMSSIMSTTDFDTLFKGNFLYLTQLFLFYGIFIAFAVKTPTIFLNTWLLKAHVESPLGGSIILAAIVLKLSLYGILRLILPVLPKAYMEYTYVIFLIGVITIVYASLSTLRTIDIKELIAYSSVSHAAVYLLAVFSNSIQGIEGAINLGLAHGLVSPGLFISAGGVLYDRSHTRVISFYKGVTQVMPLFSILFFILCLANCGAPLSLNFIGEFLSLYGVFERSSLFGVFASSSIIFSAAYTIYMYQRIAFGGVYSRMFTFSIPDLTKREFTILLLLVIPTVLFGIYPAPILDAVHYSVSTLIYSFDFSVISCDAARGWGLYFQDSTVFYHTFFASFFWVVVTIIAIKYKRCIKDSIKDKYNRYGKFVLYFMLANISLCSIITFCYVLLMLHNLLCTVEYVILIEILNGPAEQFAVSNCIDSHSIVENSPSVEWKNHLLLSSTGEGGSNPSTSNPASGYYSSKILSGQSSIQDEVDTFVSSKETYPDSEDLRKTCKNDPKTIYERSTEFITEVEIEKKEVIDKIDREVDANRLSKEEAAVMKEDVETGAEMIVDEIKETNDTAVDYIDDTSDTEEFIFRKPNK